GGKPMDRSTSAVEGWKRKVVILSPGPRIPPSVMRTPRCSSTALRARDEVEEPAVVGVGELSLLGAGDRLPQAGGDELQQPRRPAGARQLTVQVAGEVDVSGEDDKGLQPARSLQPSEQLLDMVPHGVAG